MSGFEPLYKVLQTLASPLGHMTMFVTTILSQK